MAGEPDDRRRHRGAAGGACGDLRAGGLVASGVVHVYAGVAPVRALDGLDLEVGAGACVALVGEIGSGKTTLLRCFNRMAEPQPSIDARTTIPK